jgi:hypothetical protein
MKKIISFILILTMLSACDILDQIASQAEGVSTSPSSSEIVQGLKTALKMGTNYAVENLHKANGYYGNSIVRIPLPPDVQKVVNIALNNKTVKSLGMDKVLQKKVNNFVKAVNRSAEAAAIEAKPIFVDAVTNLSIPQGLDILQGKDLSHKVGGFDSLAATHYLAYRTRQQLFNLYKPKINSTLNKDLGLGFSANQAWSQVTKYYNSFIAPVLGKSKINYTLADFATDKALDGLFYMVGQEEKKIRKDPYKFASDIIKKVFGYVFKG